VSEILGATEGGEEILVVEQTEEVIADDSEMIDDLMPRSSPDGSTDTDVDDEQHGNNSLLYAPLSSYLITFLLCGRPIIRIARLARTSIRLSRTATDRNLKTKKRRKIKSKIAVDPAARVNRLPVFSSKVERSKVKITGRKNLKNLASSLLMGGSARGSSATGADDTLRHC